MACGGLSASAASAGANVLTVDDDRAQCTSADYSSLVEAVGMASQGDTIRICDGTYLVPGGAGSSGLKIEKNVKLVGAGADKVFVQPDGSSPTAAGATPNERDEFGNVITVKRRTVELADVEISGLTVRGAGTAVEAGIAMIDVNESVLRNVRVTDLAAPYTGVGTGPGTGGYAGPLAGHGHGIVVANTITDTVNDARLEGVAVEGFNKAGIVVDARTVAGTGERRNTLTATITDSTVTGAGTSPLVAQDGIEVWGTSAKLDLRRSRITGVAGPTATPGSAAAIYMRGANPGSLIGGSRANANIIGGNTFGAWAGTFDGTTFAPSAIDARSNYWGSSNGPSTPPTKSAGDFAGAGAPSFGAGILRDPFLGTSPAAPVAPGPVPDTAPAASFDSLVDGARAVVDQPVALDVVAADDFGVRGVEYFVDGVSIGSAATFPYEFDWTPVAADDAKVHRVSAVVTDSAGQTTELAALVQVGELPVVPPPTDTTPVPPTDTTPAPPTDTTPVPPTDTTPAPPTGTTPAATCPAPTVRLTLPKKAPKIPTRRALRPAKTIVRAVTLGLRVGGRSTVTATATVRYRYKGKVRTATLRVAKGSVAANRTLAVVLVVPNGMQAALPVGRDVSVSLRVSVLPRCTGAKAVVTKRTFRTKITRVGVVG